MKYLIIFVTFCSLVSCGMPDQQRESSSNITNTTDVKIEDLPHELILEREVRGQIMVGTMIHKVQVYLDNTVYGVKNEQTEYLGTITTEKRKELLNQIASLPVNAELYDPNPTMPQCMDIPNTYYYSHYNITKEFMKKSMCHIYKLPSGEGEALAKFLDSYYTHQFFRM